jgi:hypothetical protein
MRKASGALEGVWRWAKAVLDYHELLKIVRPVREKVADMNA